MKKQNFILVFALVAFGFMACDNDVVVLDNKPDVPNNDFAPVASNIRVFGSVDELFAEIDKTLAMSLEELYIHERTLNQSVSAGGSMLRTTSTAGFNSFGKITDMLYASIAENEDEYTLEQIKALVSMHSEHLVLIEEEDGYYTFETRLFDSDLRYIVNENRMFQMRDTLVKVLDSATIFTPKENFRELLTVTDANVALINTENFLVIPNRPSILNPPVVNPPATGTPRPNPNLGRSIPLQENIRPSGNRRNRLRVEVFIPDERRVIGNSITERCAIRIRSHRTGIANGIWWRKQRNHEFDITVRVWHPSTIVSFRYNHGIRPVHNWEVTRFGNFTYNFSQGRACIVSVHGWARNEVNSLTINLN